MVKWRIYYDDFTTYSNEDGLWSEAPVHGVVCIVVRDPTSQWGRWVVSGWSVTEAGQKPGGNDFFCKYPDSDEPFSTPDPTPFLNKPGCTKDMLKYGRMCDTSVWNEIMHAAGHDPDFPKGSPRRRAKDWLGK